MVINVRVCLKYHSEDRSLHSNNKWSSSFVSEGAKS